MAVAMGSVDFGGFPNNYEGNSHELSPIFNLTKVEKTMFSPAPKFEVQRFTNVNGTMDSSGLGPDIEPLIDRIFKVFVNVPDGRQFLHELSKTQEVQVQPGTENYLASNQTQQPPTTQAPSFIMDQTLTRDTPAQNSTLITKQTNEAQVANSNLFDYNAPSTLNSTYPMPVAQLAPSISVKEDRFAAHPLPIPAISTQANIAPVTNASTAFGTTAFTRNDITGTENAFDFVEISPPTSDVLLDGVLQLTDQTCYPPEVPHQGFDKAMAALGSAAFTGDDIMVEQPSSPEPLTSGEVLDGVLQLTDQTCNSPPRGYDPVCIVDPSPGTPTRPGLTNVHQSHQLPANSIQRSPNHWAACNSPSISVDTLSQPCSPDSGQNPDSPPVNAMQWEGASTGQASSAASNNSPKKSVTSSSNPDQNVRAVTAPNFLLALLETKSDVIRWDNDSEDGTFKITDSKKIAKMWADERSRAGCRRTASTYENFSRTIRHHYRKGEIVAVEGRRLTYKFGRNGPYAGVRQRASTK